MERTGEETVSSLMEANDNKGQRNTYLFGKAGLQWAGY